MTDNALNDEKIQMLNSILTEYNKGLNNGEYQAFLDQNKQFQDLTKNPADIFREIREMDSDQYQKMAENAYKIICTKFNILCGICDTISDE